MRWRGPEMHAPPRDAPPRTRMRPDVPCIGCGVPDVSGCPRALHENVPGCPPLSPDVPQNAPAKNEPTAGPDGTFRHIKDPGDATPCNLVQPNATPRNASLQNGKTNPAAHSGAQARARGRGCAVPENSRNFPDFGASLQSRWSGAGLCESESVRSTQIFDSRGHPSVTCDFVASRARRVRLRP
jgi:hypothetical protein